MDQTKLIIAVVLLFGGGIAVYFLFSSMSSGSGGLLGGLLGGILDPVVQPLQSIMSSSPVNGLIETTIDRNLGFIDDFAGILDF